MIWCVEDDSSIRDIEVYALTSTGFEAKGFEDGDSFWNALQSEKPELVVLDVMLPGKDGVTLLKLDGLVLNPDEHTVTIDRERIILTYKEYELLYLFLSQPGIAFTREQLLSSVWNTEYAGETRTVDMHIRTLRQKLGNYGNIIETVRNVGYRLENKYDK